MRGGGTSQAGQAIGSGLIVDTSKYFNRILEVNAAERWARVEPGIVLDELNARAAAARPALRARHLHRQPRHRRRHDGEQLERRAVGALRQDDRSRARAARRAVRRIARPTSGRSDARELDAAVRAATRSKAPCYREVRRLARECTRRDRPPLSRRSCAASAATTWTRSSDPAQAVQPGEADGRLRGHARRRRSRRRSALVPLPEAKAVLAIQFADLLEALEATPAILAHRPSAVEVMDRFILDHTKQSAGARAPAPDASSTAIPARCCASSSTPTATEDLPPRLDALERDLTARRSRLPLPPRASTPRRRRASGACARRRSGLSMAMKGDAKSLSFVEDTAVAPEKLRDYIDRFLADRPRARHHRRRLRARVGRLPARPAGRQPEDRGGRAAVRGDRRRQSPIWCSSSAARSPASTATAWCAARSWRRCSARCSTRRSGTSSGRSIRTASSTPARSSTRRR